MEQCMRHIIRFLLVLPLLTASLAWADDYDDTIKIFKDAGQSAASFKNAYGYAVFPTIGKGGIGVGFAHGSGRVYAGGKYVGDSSMNQATIGARLGGQAYSQIIFFKDKGAFDDFTSGNCGGLPQGNGGIHGCQRRPDVRSQHRRPEIFVQAPIDGAFSRLASVRDEGGRHVCALGRAKFLAF
jgi:hypothetical protein